MRERSDDIPLLAQRIIDSFDPPEREVANRLLTREYLAGLMSRRWPGNVRELRNTLERLAVFQQTAVSEAPGGASLGGPDWSLPYKRARERFERTYLEHALDRAGGNVSAAARATGLDRAFFYRLLIRHGLR